MDTVSIPEVSIGQVSDQTIPVQQRIVTPNPMQPPHENNLRKVFNISSWIILFALLPVTVLIFLSQNTVPGDLFYPVKRSLENVILAAASVNPATRAAFRTDLTATRFKEAQSLVISQANASGLATFIDDVQSTRLEVTNLKNDTQRTRAEEKLIDKLEEYQAGLSTLEAKTEQNIITYQFQEIPISAPPPTGGPTIAVSNQNKTPQNLPSLTPTSQPVPTLTPTPTLTPVPTSVSSISSSPTSTPIPTLIPTLAPTIVQTAPTVPPQQENNQIAEQKKIAQTIKETKEQLHKIKKDLEENRKEEKEKREERNESEKKDKKDGERKDNSD